MYIGLWLEAQASSVAMMKMGELLWGHQVEVVLTKCHQMCLSYSTLYKMWFLFCFVARPEFFPTVEIITDTAHQMTVHVPYHPQFQVYILLASLTELKAQMVITLTNAWSEDSAKFVAQAPEIENCPIVIIIDMNIVSCGRVLSLFYKYTWKPGF